MKPWELQHLVDPETRAPLTLDATGVEHDDVMSGSLASSRATYQIDHGIPNLLTAQAMADKAKVAQTFYDSRSETYDQYLHLTFRTHGEDERAVRNGFVDLLGLTPTSKVLEVAAGTGRDSEIIASRLSSDSVLCLQDISNGMLSKAKLRLRDVAVPISYALSDATRLPYPDRHFDCVFSFGGLGEFPDIRRALAEMVRVCRVGGKIVVGDESMPVWWRNTEFAKILSTTNPQFMAPVPFEDIPVEARQFHIRWVIGGVFYLIDFVVGDGPPNADFDYRIPGVRGGTLRTRYEGQLEGVTPEAKHLAHQARAKRDISMHDWLEEAVRAHAERDLGSR